MKKLLHYFLFFLITTPLFSQIPAYYNDVNLTATGNVLFTELSNKLIATHSGIPYTGSPVDVWDACDAADEDPDNASNVLLIYGYDDADGVFSTDRSRSKLDHAGSTYIAGKWNREHVFAKSLANPALVAESGLVSPGSDVHNLRPADQDRNSTRSNNKFTDGSGFSRIISTNGGWYPGDEWKGDIARIVLYMYTRYNGDGSQSSETNCLPINVGFGTVNSTDSNMVDLFLQWNVEDPVSDFEANRNEVLAGIQGNRNPFIDNPYLATLIWGGLAAEDKWNMGGSSDAEVPSIPTSLVASNITDTSATISWNASTDNVGVYDYLVFVNGVYTKSTTTTSISLSGLTADTSYQIAVKARDASNNISELSSSITVTTLVGPLVLFTETFSDCASVLFFAYNEASTKNWACETQYGENNSGSYGINGYQEDVASKDWLITKSPIDFEAKTGEKLSFYTDAAYGNSPLDLVYSADYDGSSNPSSFTWNAVPNIATLVHNNTSTEVIYSFSDVDISTITGTVYFAFKYYSNGNPTRWTVDNFKITADQSDDVDNDGVLNVNDSCPNTPSGETVDENGCSYGQLDDDNDGVENSIDACADTPAGESVNATGCAESQLDDDDDGVNNNLDLCPNTPDGEVIDANGCSYGQLDDDNDGVQNSLDLCENTPAGETVNASGCGASQLDDDNDGFMNNVDLCPNTPAGETVDANGCSYGQLDDDNDGVENSLDLCTNTPSGESVNSTGCAESELDDDNDGVMNNVDTCPNTPTGVTVDANGCSEDQQDDDNDGVQNSIDICPNTPAGESVNSKGCSSSQLDDDIDGVMNNVDTCPNTPLGDVVNASGCGESQLDDDNDGVTNDIDKCPNTTSGSTVDANGCLTLGYNNFSFETISETCTDKNNGQIKITAQATYSYIATVNGTEYSFTNNSLTINNLEPNVYSVCISIIGETFTQCYEVTINAGTSVSGKSSQSSKAVTFTIESGTAPYSVFVNNEEVLTTNETEFSVENVKQGDQVQVKTAVVCEGVLSKTINLLDGIYAYPNPTKGNVEIVVTDANEDVYVELYNIQSQLVLAKSYNVENGKIQLNIEDKPTGIYIVKVILNKQSLILKLIKE
ncbi:endonuclease [Lutibacter sp.]|uniref:endonuclease n=1 Tax=Lutibacter sp. TaxID=1925666 RepID=UPI003568E1AF